MLSATSAVAVGAPGDGATVLHTGPATTVRVVVEADPLGRLRLHQDRRGHRSRKQRRRSV